MIFIITGNIGVGKTTTLKNLIGLIKKNHSIFGTLMEVVMEDGKRRGYTIEDLRTGEKMVIARRSNKIGFKFCEWYFNEDAIIFGRHALEKSGDILFVDYIGKLELSGQGFSNVFDVIRTHKGPVFAIVRREIVKKVIKKIGEDSKVYKITLENRDKMYQNIYTDFLEQCRSR